MLAFGTRVGLEEVAVRTRLVAALSTSPTTTGMGPIGVCAEVVWLAIGEMTGGSFTGLTVTVKVRLMTLLLLCPSLTVTVMRAIPLASVAGAKVKLPVLPGLT